MLDTAKERFEIIIPLGFDTIIKPDEGSIASDQVVKDWLRNDYTRFQSVFKRIEGKDEYAVQISYIPSEIGSHLPEPSQEVNRIKTEMAKKSPGIAYIYKTEIGKDAQGRHGKAGRSMVQRLL